MLCQIEGDGAIQPVTICGGWSGGGWQGGAGYSGATLTCRKDLLERTRALHGEALTARVVELLEKHEELGSGASLWFGRGNTPSVTAAISIGGAKLQPLALYVDRELRWAVNFDWIHKGGQGISTEGMSSFAEALAEGFER